MLTIIAERYTK